MPRIAAFPAVCYSRGGRGFYVRERLDSWKDIGGYLGRDIRTAQRWALNRGLPVRRVPGGDKPRVFALKSEIDGWLNAEAAGLPTEIPSIAVLPFVNMSGDPADECFGDGLTDDVIDALARIPDLRVTARTSSFAFRNVQQDVREIGSRLGAANLLEGSVRRIGDRVRVSAQLVSASDGYHLWSQSYDRRLVDMFAIQSEIAHSIALALKVRLTVEPRGKRPTENPKAYEFWLKGRSIGAPNTPEAYARAHECYAAAIGLDPNFAEPYADTAAILFHGAEFGMNTSPDAPRQARDLVLKALELNDGLEEGHAVMGMVRALVEYDWAGAELSFQRALQISPGSAFVRLRHAWYCLLPQRNVEQALVEAEEAVAQDPLNPMAHNVLGLVFMVACNPARAEEECRIAADLAPGLWMPQWCLGASMMMRRKLFQGFRQCRSVHDRFPLQPAITGAMCMLYAKFFRRKKARQFLAQLVELSNTAYVPPVAFAMAYFGLGDDRAFEWFDKAIEVRDPGLTQLASLPFFDHARGDPRFHSLLVRMNLT
jgi:TolB-like protein/tetratricopeptide (TPR) repeat protein